MPRSVAYRQGRIRQRTAFVAVAAGCLVGMWVDGAAAASVPECRTKPPRPVYVTLNVDYGTVAFNHELGQAQIHNLYMQDGTPSAGVHGMAVGLTRLVVNMEFQTRVVTEPTGDGRYCAWLTGVDATVRYADTNVYVDRRYKTRSCEFAVILDHERQHVVINRTTLRRFSPQIRAELEAAVNRINPILVDQIQQAQNMPGTLLQQELDPVLRNFNHERERVNAAIDTPEVYRHSLTRCDHW